MHDGDYLSLQLIQYRMLWALETAHWAAFFLVITEVNYCSEFQIPNVQLPDPNAQNNLY